MSENFAINRGRGRTWRGSKKEQLRLEAVEDCFGPYVLSVTGIVLGTPAEVRYVAILRRIDSMLVSRKLKTSDLSGEDIESIADEAISKE